MKAINSPFLIGKSRFVVGKSVFADQSPLFIGLFGSIPIFSTGSIQVNHIKIIWNPHFSQGKSQFFMGKSPFFHGELTLPVTPKSPPPWSPRSLRPHSSRTPRSRRAWGSARLLRSSKSPDGEMVNW